MSVHCFETLSPNNALCGRQSAPAGFETRIATNWTDRQGYSGRQRHSGLNVKFALPTLLSYRAGWAAYDTVYSGNYARRFEYI